MQPVPTIHLSIQSSLIHYCFFFSLFIQLVEWMPFCWSLLYICQCLSKSICPLYTLESRCVPRDWTLSIKRRHLITAHFASRLLQNGMEVTFCKLLYLLSTCMKLPPGLSLADITKWVKAGIEYQIVKICRHILTRWYGSIFGTHAELYVRYSAGGF